MAGDGLREAAVEAGAKAIWTRYTTSKICTTDHRDIPWTTLVRWGLERPLIQDLVNTAREESAAALDGWVALLDQRGWQLVPKLHEGKAAMTHEMADAFHRAMILAGNKHGFYESMNAGWNAAIAAAANPFAEAPDGQ